MWQLGHTMWPIAFLCQHPPNCSLLIISQSRSQAVMLNVDMQLCSSIMLMTALNCSIQLTHVVLLCGTSAHCRFTYTMTPQSHACHTQTVYIYYLYCLVPFQVSTRSSSSRSIQLIIAWFINTKKSKEMFLGPLCKFSLVELLIGQLKWIVQQALNCWVSISHDLRWNAHIKFV